MFQQIIRELVFIEEQKEKDDNAIDNDDDDDDGDDDDGERKYFLFKLQYFKICFGNLFKKVKTTF